MAVGDEESGEDSSDDDFEYTAPVKKRDLDFSYEPLFIRPGLEIKFFDHLRPFRARDGTVKQDQFKFKAKKTVFVTVIGTHPNNRNSEVGNNMIIEEMKTAVKTVAGDVTFELHRLPSAWTAFTFTDKEPVKALVETKAVYHQGKKTAIIFRPVEKKYPELRAMELTHRPRFDGEESMVPDNMRKAWRLFAADVEKVFNVEIVDKQGIKTGRKASVTQGRLNWIIKAKGDRNFDLIKEFRYLKHK